MPAPEMAHGDLDRGARRESGKVRLRKQPVVGATEAFNRQAACDRTRNKPCQAGEVDRPASVRQGICTQVRQPQSRLAARLATLALVPADLPAQLQRRPRFSGRRPEPEEEQDRIDPQAPRGGTTRNAADRCHDSG